jgi:hypothetical protein
VRKISLLSCLPVVLLACVWACDSDSSSDGGSDATTEPNVDLCDPNAFIASGGSGHTCPNVSSRVCFPVCDAGGGCTCTGTDIGPIWECYNPPACVPCNDSPFADAGCPDADAGPVIDASDASSDDASDAGDED